MGPTTLQALRRLLFFTQAEAAALIGGVSERSWLYWEHGGRPIPASIAARVEQLIDWREHTIDALESTVADWMPPTDKHPRLIWYISSVDWMSLPNREPVLWRPHCSAISELCARHHGEAVPFDRPAYEKWLGRRGDSENMRGKWAAEVGYIPRRTYHPSPRKKSGRSIDTMLFRLP